MRLRKISATAVSTSATPSATWIRWAAPSMPPGANCPISSSVIAAAGRLPVASRRVIFQFTVPLRPCARVPPALVIAA